MMAKEYLTKTLGNPAKVFNDFRMTMMALLGLATYLMVAGSGIGIRADAARGGFPCSLCA